MTRVFTDPEVRSQMRAIGLKAYSLSTVVIDYDNGSLMTSMILQKVIALGIRVEYVNTLKKE